MDRISIINRAKELTGPTSFPLSLNHPFDALLIEITTEYPVLKNQLLSGTTVEDQAYQDEVFPPHYRLDHDNEMMFVDDGRLSRIEIEGYLYAYNTATTIVPGDPSHYTVDMDNSRIYWWTTPDDTYDYKFYHTITHPRAGRTLSFTSGGTYEIRPGATIAGVSSTKTALVEFVKVTSGTWALGTAAGTLILSAQSGAFTSENLNIGANLNVATIAADSSSEDQFQHLMGPRFDNALIYGLAYKACELTSPPQMEKSIFYQSKYESEILDQVIVKVGKRPGMRSNFWNSNWR